MSRDNSSKSGGIGFIGVLQVAFIVLKLCKVIDWGWIWVLAPAWINIIIIGLCIVICALAEK